MSLLPGLGLPINYIPDKCFPYVDVTDNPYDSDVRRDWRKFNELKYEHPVLTLRELCMLRAMNEATDKPNWEQKIFDPTISSKWKEELMSMETPLNVGFTEAMADWCIAEFRHAAQVYNETGSIHVFNRLVQKSNTAVPESLNKRLRKAVAPLENVPPKLQDWHPESDNKVLNLVHPSLYPLIYGLTRVLPIDQTVGLEDCLKRSCQGSVLPVAQASQSENSTSVVPPLRKDGYSENFQWLPCNVEFLKNNKLNYINNLHPKKNAELYPVISDIIECCIPLWNETLTAAVNPKRVRINFDGYPLPKSLAVPFLQNVSDSDLKEKEAWEERYRNDPEPDRRENESWEAFDVRIIAWEKRFYPSTQPEPLGTFTPNWRESSNDRIGPHWSGHSILNAHMSKENMKLEYVSVPPVDLRSQFAKDGIQVIVKLTNIQLTPEKPEYTGGTWHIEGQMNEHICASAIYYYDSENITESSLAFRYRCASEIELQYCQNAHHWFYDIYGLKSNSRLNQTFGSVTTNQGRLLTFANILQHQVQPFKLLDPTKPGHRKILALFLVDPHIRIISTANVACQQKNWWWDTFTSGSQDALSKGLNRLPGELQRIIFELVDYPPSREDAEDYRLDLMDERTWMNSSSEGGCNQFEDFQFSLCEH